MASDPSRRPRASSTPVWQWIGRHKVASAVVILIAVTALLAAIWFAVPELLMNWTDRVASRAAKHVQIMRHNAEKVQGVTGLSPRDLEAGYWSAAGPYWNAAADLASYLSVTVTVIGVFFTVVVVVYGAQQVKHAAGQVSVAMNAMRSSARQQQMRLLFDLDLALLGNPELLAMAEGKFDLDPATLVRAKSNAFAHAFLNACDTVYDYYAFIDPEGSNTHWPAWKSQLEYYLRHRPELRSMARQSIERNFYTERFRKELDEMINKAERLPDVKREMPDIIITEPDVSPSLSAPVLRELSQSCSDAKTLKTFYETVYVREFPNPDERESLANMENYLRHKKPTGCNCSPHLGERFRG